MALEVAVTHSLDPEFERSYRDRYLVYTDIDNAPLDSHPCWA